MSESDKAAQKLVKSIRTSRTPRKKTAPKKPAAGKTEPKNAKTRSQTVAPATVKKTPGKKASSKRTAAGAPAAAYGPAGRSKRSRRTAKQAPPVVAPLDRRKRPDDPGPVAHALGGLRWPD